MKHSYLNLTVTSIFGNNTEVDFKTLESDAVTMTVGELIDHLQEFDADTPVYASICPPEKGKIQALYPLKPTLIYEQERGFYAPDRYTEGWVCEDDLDELPSEDDIDADIPEYDWRWNIGDTWEDCWEDGWY